MYLDNLMYSINYYIILNYALICIILIIVLNLISFLLSKKSIYFEKQSSYECGFESFGTSKQTLDIQFYLIGILYLIFDLEIIILLPWILNLNNHNLFHYLFMYNFIIILTIGFIYEWIKGSFNWI